MKSRACAGGGSTLDQCVARLFYDVPGRPNLDDVGSVSAAHNWLQTNGFFPNIDYFVTNGGRQLVIFNELDRGPNGPDPGEPQYAIDRRVIAYLSYTLRNAYWNGGGANRLLYTLFPGPLGFRNHGHVSTYFTGPEWNPPQWTNYDMWANGQPQTFGQKYGGGVDQAIADKTMLNHGGTGIFDGVALHCYDQSPEQFASPTPGENQTDKSWALIYLQWLTAIDATGGVYVTECGGQVDDDTSPNFGDSAVAGKALADFCKNANDQFRDGGPGFLRAVYGYILDTSNAGATSNGRYRINRNYIQGFNYRRIQLGF